MGQTTQTFLPLIRKMRLAGEDSLRLSDDGYRFSRVAKPALVVMLCIACSSWTWALTRAKNISALPQRDVLSLVDNENVSDGSRRAAMSLLHASNAAGISSLQRVAEQDNELGAAARILLDDLRKKLGDGK